MHRRDFLAGAAALCGAGLVRPARAETGSVSVARGFAIPHLPVMVMEHQSLFRKHLDAAGLASVATEWVTLGSGSVMNDALISGNLSFATGGPPPMLTLWSRTKGTPMEVRGVCNQAIMPMYLNTKNSGVRSIEDFTEKDRIAVSAIKVSIQAIIVQMAAAQKFGMDAYDRLDELTVGMNAVDATTALRSDQSPVTANVSLPPFQYQELKLPNIHKVLSSYDVVGEPHTFSMVWTTRQFQQQNPGIYKAFLAAITEATDLIRSDKPKAAQIYLDVTGAKDSLEETLALLNNPEIEFTTVPKGTFRLAEFMHSIGTLEADAESWKDYFFEDIHSLPGS
ncbi:MULTISPECIES: ABC transporter substrate-binding protein [unclassified Sinorhizobium]|uniref:ABC transporter substrate-binding protein n=1 Tax=unclassified Sinorhizobium TaxID=2613772 RepID=UPI0024C459C6|nr:MULTISPECIES: ABC transporter substrate-binding protein [unclassified Sinorhizobium]MDK1377302.1 ABC transporter substrate-binding protein [Sinorhizobium sp. 6-70]MDK1481577.1 ABC transporter substrate-binding protein [Sinorhizobium sp. 6-117]